MKRGIPVAWHGLNRMVTGWLVLLIVTFASVPINAAPTNTEQSPSLLVMGDSLSAAYGIEREEGWVSLLAERLEGEVNVINASISGETTSGGLQRFSDILGQQQPDIVLLDVSGCFYRSFPLVGKRVRHFSSAFLTGRYRPKRCTHAK